jgi:hypothetical protein
MKKNKKYLSCIASLLIAASMASTVGCTSKTEQRLESEATETYDFENQEKNYGDVVHEDDKSYALPLTYDSRFITSDMAETVANYFYAIQVQDLDLYNESTIEFYKEYLIDVVYADDEYTEETFLEGLYNGIKSVTGDNFKIQNIEIADFDDSDETMENIYKILDDLSGEDYTNEKIQDGAKLTINFVVEADSEEYSKTDETVYLIKYDEKYHLITG